MTKAAVPGERTPVRQPPRGFALLTVLLLVGLLAVLTTGALATTARLRVGGSLAVTESRTLTSLEYALQSVALEWNARGLADQNPGTVRHFDVLPPISGVATVHVSVARVSGGVAWTVAEVSTPSGTTRRISRALLLPAAPFDSAGVVTAAGSVVLGSGVSLSTAGCGDDPSGRVVAGGSVVDETGSSVSRIPITHGSTAITILSVFDSLTVAAISRNATTRTAAGSSITLSTADAVVYAAGDLTVTGGSGSGLMYVAGRLTVSGPVLFSGLIIALGGVTVNTDEASFEGLLVGGSGASGQASVRIVGRGISLRGSVCVARSALQAAIPPRPASGRSWAELY